MLIKRYLRRGSTASRSRPSRRCSGAWPTTWPLAEREWGGDSLTIGRAVLRPADQPDASSPTRRPSPAPARRWASWPPASSCPITDDMGRDAAGIFQTLRDAALIQQTGGGNGFSFSRLRPQGRAGQIVGRAWPPGRSGFLRVYDKAFGEIAQGGTRRGANMAVLRVDHPDVEEFITCKTDENQITNFNISVGITDAFMQAVRRRRLDLRPAWRRTFTARVVETGAVRARDLRPDGRSQAHHNGEPGVLFLDAANRSNPGPASVPAGSDEPVRRAVAGPVRKLLPRLDQPGRAHGGRRQRWTGRCCARASCSARASWTTW